MGDDRIEEVTFPAPTCAVCGLKSVSAEMDRFHPTQLYHQDLHKFGKFVGSNSGRICIGLWCFLIRGCAVWTFRSADGENAALCPLVPFRYPHRYRTNGMLFIRPVDSRSVLVPCATARQVSAAVSSENSRCVCLPAWQNRVRARQRSSPNEREATNPKPYRPFTLKPEP